MLAVDRACIGADLPGTAHIPFVYFDHFNQKAQLATLTCIRHREDRQADKAR